MPIVEKLLQQVEEKASRATPIALCIGAHWTMVTLEVAGERLAGISSTLHGGSDDHHHGKRPPVPQAGRLLEKSTPDLAALAHSDSLLEASVGLATINALLDVDVSACREVNAEEIIVEQGTGKNVAIIGHFPFTPRIRSIAKETWILELNPGEDDIPAQRAPEILPQADVIALTGTSILNHTFDTLIKLCNPAAYVLVLGGTTPLSPLLFDHGVKAVAGTRIIEPDAASQTISQGATFKQIQGKQLLTLFP